ncbi:MAG: hypothetical protein ABJF23_11740 [Bryobacteraceae bacterium]
MVIRSEQMNAFAKASATDFQGRMVIHLKKCFPPECNTLGEAGVREMIRYGTGRAAVHEAVAERDVCKFIDLMMVYGRDFDAELPWASQILNDRVVRSASARMDLLFQAAKEKQIK